MIYFHSNEKRDLSRIDYSVAGSYYYLTEDYFKRSLKLTPFYTGEMTNMSDMSFHVELLKNGQSTRYHYYGDVGSLRIIEPQVYADIAFANDDFFRVRGFRGAAVRLVLDSNSKGRGAAALESIARLKDGSFEGFFGKHGYMRFVALKGSIEVKAEYDYEAGKYACLEISFLPDEDGTFEAAAHTYFDRFVAPESYPAFDDIRQANIDSFNDFYKHYKNLPLKKYGKLIEDTIYVTWSHVMRNKGFMKTPMIMMHHNALACAMSWQLAYNGMAFLNDPVEAFRLIETMFLYQTPVSGALPGSVAPGSVGDDKMQAPLQGCALNLVTRLCGEDFITKEMAESLLPKFERWTNFWTTFRTAGRGDDLIAINNPNESGWDDASTFKRGFPASNSDTIALLIECMYACSTLARRAGQPEVEAHWKERGDKLLKILIDEYWDGVQFVTKKDGENVDSNSLASYIPIILADKLPQHIIDKCAEVLTEEGHFLSPVGLCSESMKSELCHWGFHFVLGRAVAPQQMFITVGLALAGKKEEAKLIASRWLATVEERGLRLGYHPYNEYPLTGEPHDVLIQPVIGDSWSWCGWSACSTMTMLQIVMGDEE